MILVSSTVAIRIIVFSVVTFPFTAFALKKKKETIHDCLGNRNEDKFKVDNVNEKRTRAGNSTGMTEV